MACGLTHCEQKKNIARMTIRKFVEPRPFADPEAAARKLMEIASSSKALINRHALRSLLRSAAAASSVEPAASAALMSVPLTVDVGAGNYDDKTGCHDPKGVVADYWDVGEHPHNGAHSQHDG
jgi:hypothetical protein